MLQVLRVAAHKQQHVLQRVATCWSVLQRVAACCSVTVLQNVATWRRPLIPQCLVGVAGGRAQLATAVVANVVCAHLALRRAA